MVKKPAENVTLSSEEGEVLIAHVHQSNLPAAVAGRLEQIIRTCLWLVFALQETKITVSRLRRVLFGKSPKVSPAPEESSASRQADGHETSTAGGEPAAPAGEAPPEVSQTPERAKPKGGHRPGTGRLGADAYVGAERVECRHEELAVGQRCPLCGQGNLYALPPGVEMRIDGHGVLSTIRYELHKLRCSAFGKIFTASLPTEAGEAKYSAPARAVLAIGRYDLGLPF